MLHDHNAAFSYASGLLVGERVRLRGTRDDDLPTLAKWEMHSVCMATLPMVRRHRYTGTCSFYRCWIPGRSR